MNRLLICTSLLIAANTLPAQYFLHKTDSAFVRMVDLPAHMGDKNIRVYDVARQNFVYIFQARDFYSLFGTDSFYAAYRDFDFAQYHILGQLYCKWCEQSGCGNGEARSGCHRNACDFEWIWSIRSNEKAFNKIPFTGGRLLTKYNFRYARDTVVLPAKPADSGKATWCTTGRGDCHAQFRHEILADKYHPVTVLKQYYHYGGCRAAGGKYFELVFRPQPGTRFYRKSVMRVEMGAKWAIYPLAD